MSDLVFHRQQLIRIARILQGYTYRYRSEEDFQSGIASVLSRTGLACEREVVLTDTDRIDFLVEGKYGIECKTRGGLEPALRQLARYADRERIAGLLLATPFHRLSNDVPEELGGKPVRAVYLGGI